jgi:hypothetical protein
VHDPQLGNGPLMLLARMVHSPDVLQPYARRAQIRPRGAYREPDRVTAHSQSPLRIELKDPGPGHMDRGERGQHRKPSLSVRKPQGQRSPQQRLSPVMRRTRGDEHNRRSGTACRELANATQMHAPRPASAEGKRASTSGVPGTSRIAILSASQCAKRSQGRPYGCDCRRSRKIVAHTNTNARQPRIATRSSSTNVD